MCSYQTLKFAIQGMILAKAAEGSSEVIALLQEENAPKPLLVVLRDSSTGHCFSQLHWQSVKGPLGAAPIAVYLSYSICGNPFQRAERSDGGMKADTLDAVGSRNIYDVYSRGCVFLCDFAAEPEFWSASNPSSTEKSSFKTTHHHEMQRVNCDGGFWGLQVHLQEPGRLLWLLTTWPPACHGWAACSACWLAQD